MKINNDNSEKTRVIKRSIFFKFEKKWTGPVLTKNQYCFYFNELIYESFALIASISFSSVFIFLSIFNLKFSRAV